MSRKLRLIGIDSVFFISVILPRPKGTVKMENEYKDEGQIEWETLTDGGEETPPEVPPETPPQDGSEGSPEPTGKTVNISGKSFVVNDDVAQALTAFTQATDRRFDERSQELGGLRQFKNDTLLREQELLAKTNNQSPAVDYGSLMYEDPDKFVGSIDEKIETATNNLRTEYQQLRQTENEEKVFWNSIWAENPELARVKVQATDVIKMIGQKYASQNLPNTKQVRDALAKEARDWMTGIGVGNNTTDNTDSFVEGSSAITQAKPKKTEEKPRTSTKAFLEKKREKKRSAMAG